MSSTAASSRSSGDRKLWQRVLASEAGAWADFVDRFLPTVEQVLRHSAHMRSAQLEPDEFEEIVTEVFAKLAASDFAVLRRFGNRAKPATYLAVVVRRLVVERLHRRQAILRRKAQQAGQTAVPPELQLESEEERQRVLRGLRGTEGVIAHGFWVENASFEDLSQDTGVPVEKVIALLRKLRKRVSG